MNFRFYDVFMISVEWRPVEEQEIAWKLSYSCFDQGVQAFESVGDITNQALLLSNIGQLMRICAQAHAMAGTDGENKREFSPGERHYYTKVGILIFSCLLFYTMIRLSL